MATYPLFHIQVLNTSGVEQACHGAIYMYLATGSDSRQPLPIKITCSTV